MDIHQLRIFSSRLAPGMLQRCQIQLAQQLSLELRINNLSAVHPGINNR